jgi:hypothetical protein
VLRPHISSPDAFECGSPGSELLEMQEYKRLGKCHLTTIDPSGNVSNSENYVQKDLPGPQCNSHHTTDILARPRCSLHQH